MAGGAQIPLFPFDCLGIEDGPLRSGCEVRRGRTFVDGQGGVDVVHRRVFDSRGIAPIARDIRIEKPVERPVGIAVFHLIIEALAHLVDDDRVLPVAHAEARGADLGEDGAILGPPDVVRPRADDRPLAEGAVSIKRLVRRAPERCTNRHGGQLAAGILGRELVGGEREFLGQPRVEHPAEVDIARAPARADDDGLLGPDGDGFRVHVDVAVGAKALERRRGSGQDRGGVACLDAEHPSPSRASRGR